MDLEASLRSIRSLSDVPRLVAALGHTPLWEAIPEQQWSRGAGGSSIMAVGQTGRLPWFATESSRPARDAVALAQRLSRRGLISIVLALDPTNHRLALAVAFERVPHLDLSLERVEDEALASLVKLARVPEGGPLAFAAMAADALAAEPVGHRFFREFRSTLERMAAGLPGPMRPDDRHALALLQLTRVLFLYFVQTKGWLAGRDRFLAEAVDSCLSRGHRIHRDLLRPLFFGTLNRPAQERSKTARELGSLPFLNGGLFEPHALERRFRADIPNDLWRDAFQQLFERFHFTVVEGDRAGSVAPDMLGRVFEGVMTPEARHASGTFYTPASLVRRVFDAALVPLLARRLRCHESQAERHLGEGHPSVARILDSLTVLDPAAGSGAFLLCALERLSAPGAETTAAARKRRVLQRNLFGVDLNATAVRLAELRLWLAVIADDRAEQPDAVSPLPNLDCLIRQGDSLFDPVGIELAGSRTQGTPDVIAELTALRRDLVTASGSHKGSLVRRLRGVEARVLDESLHRAEADHRSEIADCLQQARTGDLFGGRRGLDRELRSRLERLRIGLRRLRQARRSLSRNVELPWFHYQSHFADVFFHGGFDLVIGNPPWLRSEAIPPPMRQQLAGRYRWWRAGGGGRYANSPDLALAFVERALELARREGVVALLIPAKIATAGYGAVARHALATSTTLHAVADLTGDATAEFNATVYPLALIASQTPPPRDHRVRAALELSHRNSVTQSALRGGGPWILIPSRIRRVISWLEREHPRLGDSVTCHLGLKTGLNRVFLNPPSQLEPEVLRWAIRGRDLSPFGCRCRLKLLWTHDQAGLPRPELPPQAKAYLEGREAELRARKDFKGGPVWTLFRARSAVARYRVVWADLARRLMALALTTGQDLDRIPLNTCYLAALRNAAEAQALAAWLNSTWVRITARLGAVPASGGFARFNAQVVARLPLPASVLSDASLTRLARAAAAGNPVQNELDGVVARLLGLSSSAQRTLRAALGDSPNHRR